MSSVNLNTSFLFHQGSRSRSPTFHLFHTLTKLPISSITTKKPQKGNRFFPFPSFSVSVVLTKEEVLKGKEENKESEKPAFNFKSYMVNRARNFDNLPSLRHFEDLMVTPLALTVCHGGSAGAVTEGAPELLPKEKDSEGGEGGNKQGQQGKASEGEERASESPCKAESQRGMMKSSDKPPKGSNSGTLAAESPVVNNRSDELQGSPATPNMDVKAESKNFSQELQQLREYCMNQKSIDSMSDLAQSSVMTEYDLLVEGDLFKAPEPIIEEPLIDVDPMTAAAISMISCGEDVSSQGLESQDIDILQNDNQLLSEVFYECKKDLIEKAAIESPLSDILEINIPALNVDDSFTQENKPIPDVPLAKSVSSRSLSAMDWMNSVGMKPAFLEFPGIDFNEVYGMRRAFSDGDIKTLGNGNMNVAQSPHDRPSLLSNCTSEERQEKLSRYRNKKTKRNFGRKIKYACRKALADSQPRIRGRFAKTEESDIKRQ